MEKIISASFDGSLSMVTLRTEDGDFTGIAKLHPEDANYASEYTGCGYAHERARIKALKAKRKRLIEKCEECRKFIKALEQYKDFDKTSPTAKCMYRQLHKRIKEVNELTEGIGRLMFNLQNDIAKKDIIDKKIRDKEG